MMLATFIPSDTMAPGISKADDTLRLGLWSALGLAVLSLLCGFVLLPLAAGGSGIAAGVASQARPAFEALAVLAGGVALLLLPWVGRRRPAVPAAGGEVPAAAAQAEDLESTPPTGALVPTVTPTDTHAAGPDMSGVAPETWSAALLREMDWQRFAELCAAYCRETGNHCSVTPHVEGKGIDIRLSGEEGGPVTGIVRCWGWGVHRVPTSQLTELRALMLRERIPRGGWLTNARFGDDIARYGAENRIEALDCRRFLAMLQALPTEPRQRLFQLATAGEWNVPTCPACGSKMARRPGEDADWWACRNVPSCKVTMRARGR